MVTIIEGEGQGFERNLLLSMFKERKRLFVDLLQWDVAVVGSCEVDQYDGAKALYLLALDASGNHQGSMRLLSTTRPHVLSDIFPELCDSGVPRGRDIFEISRLCLPTRFKAAERLGVRHRLISAMVDHALENGITAFTGVVEASFLEQILVMGWRSAALGYPRRIGGSRLGAFRVEIDCDTPARLAATGIYQAGCIAGAPRARAVA